MRVNTTTWAATNLGFAVAKGDLRAIEAWTEVLEHMREEEAWR